jgi:hypothetical protein
MEPLFETAGILETYRYLVKRSSNVLDELQFEDDSLMGFVWTAPSVGKLLSEWKSRQDGFLRRSAHLLRTAEMKSWNLYAVLLTQDSPSEAERGSLVAVEEDFRSTRKIVQAELTTPSKIRRALYPLLPIQNVVAIEREDVLQRFRHRLTNVPGQALNALFSDDVPDRSVKLFVEAHEVKTN